MEILRAGFPRNGYGLRNDTNEKYTKYGILKPHPRAIGSVNTVKIRDKEPRWCYSQNTYTIMCQSGILYTKTCFAKS